jgi:hypothetical protein
MGCQQANCALLLAAKQHFSSAAIDPSSWSNCEWLERRRFVVTQGDRRLCPMVVPRRLEDLERNVPH